MKQFVLFFLIMMILCNGFIIAQPSRDVDLMLSVPHSPNTLLMRFSPETTQAQKELYFLQMKVVKVHEYTTVPGLYLITLPANSDLRATLTWLLSSREIMYAEPNRKTKRISKTPNDTDYGQLWGMEKIKAPGMWDIATASTILIASLDTGIDYTHADLANNIWTNPGETDGDNVDNDGNGYIDDVHGYRFDLDNGNSGDPADDNGHGTHTAGTMGGVGNNSAGVAGVCWTVKIVAVKSFFADGSAYTSDIVAGVEYLIKNGQVKIVNMSYGSTAFEQTEADMMSAARDAGILCVCAAGNESLNNDDTPSYPACYDLDNIMSVANSDQNDALASSSNYGATSVDLMAPGENIYSTSWDASTPDYYKLDSGTSMASPHVAGACALLWSVDPSMNYEKVKSRILRNVDKISGAPVLSGGRLNLYQAYLNPSNVPDNNTFNKGHGGCSSYSNNDSNWLGTLIPYLAVLLLLVGWRIRRALINH